MNTFHDENYNHHSVLLHEAVHALNISTTGGIYIDGTFGAGGHSKLILSRLNKQGRLLAMDRDWSSVKIGKLIANRDNRLTVLHSSFSEINKYVTNMGLIGLVNGILLDLGISTIQINDERRGFSFMKDGVLDMRMDISNGQSAAKWLSTASQRSIAWVLRTFGEERFAKNIAKIIVNERKNRPILRSVTLSKLICKAIPYRSFPKKHPATKSFLAIRMYINNELEEITQVLQDSLAMLSPRGRLVVISFNSLEDRLVKNFIREHSCILCVPPKIPLTDRQIFNAYQNKYQLKNMGKLTPSTQEIKKNIRARSAVLRYAEKLIM